MMRQILLFLLMLIGGYCYSQLPGRYRIQQYSTEEGLPSNGIKGLEWDDKNGFLWIGTEAGIVRFNGIDFKIFSKKNIPALNPDRISYLFKDGTGNIHAYNQIGKYFSVDVNHLVASPQQEPWKGHSATGISAETQAWVQRVKGKANMGVLPTVFMIDINNCVVIDNLNDVYWINADTANPPLLISSAARGLFKSNGQIFLLKNDNTIHAVADNGITKAAMTITDESNKAITISATTRVLWKYGMRCPILFAGDKAWLLAHEGTGFRLREVCAGLTANSLLRYAQYDDKTHTLFIGTESKGIIVATENRVQPIKNTSPSINERTAYYSQIRLSESAIITNEGHIIGKGNIPASPIKGNFSMRTSASGDTVVWYTKFFSNKPILHRLNLKTRVEKKYTGVGFSYAVSVVDLGRKTFISTVRGIAILQGDSLQYVYRYPVALPGSLEPLDMQPYGNNALVFANCNALLRFDTERYQMDTLFLMKDYCIRSLVQINGYLFLGTYGGGFYVYHNGKTRQMPLDKNQFLMYTHCFIQDSAGFCWMSTNRGLFKASTKDLLDAFEKNLPQVYYHYLGRQDGMEITEMNGGCSPCALWLNANTLSFPTMDGLLWVNTASDHLVLPEGQLYFDQINVNRIEITYYPGNVLRLAPNTKEIEIGLGFPAWSNQENIYLEYRLNEDDPWLPVEIKSTSMIKLSNVPPGSYQLQVRKINGFGQDNYSYKTLRFTIEAPWHKQWWFYVLLGVMATGLLMLFYRIRTRQMMLKQMKLQNQVAEKTQELQLKNRALEKNNGINTRLISIISHDIVTPLKFLNVAGKNLLEKKSLMSEALKDETIKEITNTSKELQLLSTNILNWIKYQTENRRLVKEQFDLHELVNQSLSVLQSLAKQKHIQIDNAIPIGTMIWQYLEPLKILVYNLVTNAINFSEGGKITIACRQHGQRLTLSVQDEGTGMTEEQINNIMKEEIIISSANKDNRKGNGLGYLIIKDLLKTMNARLDIQSTVHVGTTVSVNLPIGNQQDI